MPYEPINRSQVVNALKDLGPMTCEELAEHLGWPTPKVTTTIASTRWLLPAKVFRIVGHKPLVGRRGRDQAMYAAEAGPDEKKKRVDTSARRKATQARYRKKHKAIISARNQASNAALRGATAVNPWAQLAPPCLRATMSAVAHATAC